MSTRTAPVSTLARLAPWTDKKGRLDPLRATVFIFVLLPGLWLALRWSVWGLGAKPVTVAIHSTGYWTIWLLLASLVVSPWKAVAGMPGVVVLRRMVGVAALAYGLIHITLYATDQSWRLLTIGSEIIHRFYLVLGAVALSGLIVLGVTSTDGAVRRLGARWKRLHRIVFGVAVLGGLHYYIQSKADVSQAVVASGVLAWLLLWRVLPAGRDRSWAPLLGLAFAAALLALGFEFAWYRFGTHVNALRVLKAEADIGYGLHPAALVLAFGLIVVAVAELRRVSQTAFGQSLGFTMLLFAAGAFVDDLGRFMFNLVPDDLPDGVSGFPLNYGAALAFALLGLARYRVRALWQRHAVDALWAVACLYPLWLVGEVADDQRTVLAITALLGSCTLVLSQRLWTISRGAAVMLVPLMAWLTFEAASFYAL